MADLILGPVVDTIVSKLIAVASDQFNLASEWNDDLRSFCLILKMLRSVLQDADEKNASGHSHLKSWLQELRAVADEADDLLEEVAYHNLQRQMATQKPKWKKVRYFLTSSNPLAVRLRMANKIKNLSRYFADINDWATRLGLQYKLGNMVPEPRVGPETHSFLSTPVAGRTEDVSKIVNLLVDSSNQHDLPVITIWGMPGLGKTTLARAVFENEKICEHFGDYKIWVCVSENFDVIDILRKSLKSISKSSSGDGDIGSKETVVKKIQGELEGKSYLLILDDVWNEKRQIWEDLRNCLLGISRNKGSRVLVTTRLENVATLMALTDEHICHPRQLTVDACWTIIKQRAFGDNNSVPQGFEEIGKQIAERCGGIPLVASIIGATLQNKREKKEWQAIIENSVWDSLEENGISDIIRFSYDRLPKLALKQCFAFCSIFPKDFVMEREMLIQLWMAQGFLESSEESCVAAEEIGDKYFKYLLSHSLFQEEERDSLVGRVISCKMHDLIHDFAQSISNCEMLIVEDRPGDNICHHVRHLNLIDGREMGAIILGDVAKRLQTLFSQHGFSSGVQVDLKRLRVLSLDGAFDAKQLPTCLGNSKSLRYLDISGTEIEELPKFITKLYNLQTFRFMHCTSLKRPPREIGDLINLRHIYFNDEDHMPANLGRLTNLQTLPLFCVGKTKGCKIEELGSLRGLKGRLEIRRLDLVKGKSEAKKAKLHEKAVDVLQLCWDFFSNHGNLHEDVLEGLKPHSNIRMLSIEGYGGKSLASWMLKSNCRKPYRIPGIDGFSFLQQLFVKCCNELTSFDDGDGEVLTSMPLKKIFIAWCDKLERFSVSGLSSLKELKIENCEVINSIGDSLSSSTCLEQLYLKGCPKLQSIPSVEGLNYLKTVYVKDCDKLEHLPSGFSSCTALEELEIWNCSNLAFIPEELHLQSLVKLEIWGCRELRSFPKILGSLARLKALGLGLFSEKLEEFPDLSSASSLEVLHLGGWENVTLPHQIQHLITLNEVTIESFNGLQEALLENLSCLKTLTIRGCHMLRRLSSGLSPLEKLSFENCPNLDSFEGELKKLPSLNILDCPKLVGFLDQSLHCCTGLKRLAIRRISEELEEFPNLSSIHASLEHLTLEEGEKLTHLPRLPQSQHLTALKELTLYDFCEMESLPDWLNELSSLQRLNIWRCPKLESLPDWFKNLSSLQWLEIWSFPNKLTERCTKGTGRDWSKISHIPNILIDWELIQSQD